MSLSFENTQTAFAYKSDKDLKKAKFLFNTMSYPLFVPIGTRITPFILKTGLPIHGIIRDTIFRQFVGGETLPETANICNLLASYGVQIILDYGVEGKQDEADYEKAKVVFKEVIEYASTQPNIPFISIKITGIARFELLHKLNDSPRIRSGIHDHEEEMAEWERVKARLFEICTLASEKNIGVLIDAEESWIQDPVDRLVIEMMEIFNKEKAIVYNTIQLYRHDRLNFLKMFHRIARQRHFILGIKLVRGAYMETERERAVDNHYASPIQPDKLSTDKDFDEAIGYCISNIDEISCIVATHNEESNKLAYDLLKEKGLSMNHPHVHFSQLYGMSDHITFNLAKEGCNVSKYLPFGPLKDVIPYLMRRAQENSSISGQTNKELALIKSELKRRKN